MEIREGETVAILGPNGSGKSTLLRILATLTTPGGGSASLDRWNVVDHPHEVRKYLGVVFQSPALDAKLTVLENLYFQGLLYELSQPLLGERIKEALEVFGLWERRQNRVEELSGGLQRRVELAKGILHRPRLLLLDEPSTGLDPAARLEFWHFLKRSLGSAPMCALLTTHLIDEAERCDRVVIMDNGTAVLDGTPAALKAQIGGDIVALRPTDLPRLKRAVQRRFRIAGTVADGEILLQVSDGARLLPQLVKAFPSLIVSATLRKPSLEDVFLRQTGHRLQMEPEQTGGAGA